MKAKTTTAAKAAAEPATPTKPRRKREPRAWYMDKYVGKIPLEEFWKNDPEPVTSPGRLDVFKKQGRWPLVEEILDMRAVLK